MLAGGAEAFGGSLLSRCLTEIPEPLQCSCADLEESPEASLSLNWPGAFLIFQADSVGLASGELFAVLSS